MRYAPRRAARRRTSAKPRTPASPTTALREQIASGGLGPGTWLREHTVATSLGLSRTPVREALRLLAAEGVVELVHNRGARVVSWSAEDIDEAYRLRALIEGYGAGLAAARADAAASPSSARCRSATSAPSTSTTRPVAECRPLPRAVQRRLPRRRPRRVRQRPAARLVAMVSSAPLVRRVLQSYDDDDRRRSVMAHRDVITAIANGDADLATSAMSSHILAARYSALRS